MTETGKNPRGLSLKARLAAGAALLGAGTVLTAIILILGLTEVGNRLQTAVDVEARIARYATLSSQAAGFLVVATEVVQTGQPPDTRIQRITPVADQLRRTFGMLRTDTTTAMQAAEHLGLDAQSRHGTQSLGIARMEASLESAITGLFANTTDTDALRAHIDGFASNFDSLLSQSVNTELLFRNAILTGIADLRRRLMIIATAIAGLSGLLVVGYYALLIRPQLRRLDDTIADRTRALTAANQALEDADTNRRRFFADLSHELRTPLTVILMEAQIGKRGTPDPTSAFATIENRASRLNRRIDDLLRVARSETGQLALDPVPTPLPDLMQGIITEITAETESAGMTLQIDPPDAITVLCDPNWARQVLAELVRNATRHAREGALIRLAPDITDTHAGLSVTDNGPGIPGSGSL
jgi:signal transduction histidine kinase